MAFYDSTNVDGLIMTENSNTVNIKKATANQAVHSPFNQIISGYYSDKLLKHHDQKIGHGDYCKIPSDIYDNKESTNSCIQLMCHLYAKADIFNRVKTTPAKISEKTGLPIGTVYHALNLAKTLRFITLQKDGMFYLKKIKAGEKFSKLPKELVQQGLSGIKLRVVLYACKHVDSHGRCYFSQAKMSNVLGYTRTYLNQIIGELENDGVLKHERTIRENGSTGICNYRIFYNWQNIRLTRYKKELVKRIGCKDLPFVGMITRGKLSRKLKSAKSKMQYLNTLMIGYKSTCFQIANTIFSNQFNTSSIYNNNKSRDEINSMFKHKIKLKAVLSNENYLIQLQEQANNFSERDSSPDILQEKIDLSEIPEYCQAGYASEPIQAMTASDFNDRNREIEGFFMNTKIKDKSKIINDAIELKKPEKKDRRLRIPNLFHGLANCFF